MLGLELLVLQWGPPAGTNPRSGLRSSLHHSREDQSLVASPDPGSRCGETGGDTLDRLPLRGPAAPGLRGTLSAVGVSGYLSRAGGPSLVEGFISPVWALERLRDRETGPPLMLPLGSRDPPVMQQDLSLCTEYSCRAKAAHSGADSRRSGTLQATGAILWATTVTRPSRPHLPATHAANASCAARGSCLHVSSAAGRVCIVCPLRNQGLRRGDQWLIPRLLVGRVLANACVYETKRNKPGLKPGAVENVHRRLGE